MIMRITCGWKRILAGVILLAAAAVPAAAQHTWIRTYGGDGVERVEAILPDGADGCFFAGRPSPAEDTWVVQVDADGHYVWKKTYILGFPDERTYLTRLADGSLAFTATLDNRSRIWASRLDPSGDPIWQMDYGQIVAGSPVPIAATADGNLVIAARSLHGEWGVLVLKVDDQGHTVWRKIYHAEAVEYPTALAAADDGGVFFVAHGHIADPWGRDIWVVRLDADGSIMWHSAFQGPGDEIPTNAAACRDGGFAVCGYSTGPTPAGERAFVLRFGEDGALLWQRTYDGPGDDRFAGIAEGPDEEIYLAGTTGSAGFGLADGWGLCLSGTGGEIWQRCYGGPLDDRLLTAAFAAGRILFAGETDSFATPIERAWILRLSPEGLVPQFCPVIMNASVPVVPEDLAPAAANGGVTPQPFPGSPAPFFHENVGAEMQLLCLSDCTVTCDANAYPASGDAPHNVIFGAEAAEDFCVGGLEILWEFGDGSFTDEAFTEHVYQLPGTYTWTLHATADGVTCTRTGTIEVTEPPQCHITCTTQAAPASGMAPLAVHFQSEVYHYGCCCGSPVTLWEFGNGVKSLQEDPVYTYDQPGVYDWRFTAELNGMACHRYGTVTVAPRPCTVTCDASAAPSSGPAPLTVLFDSSVSTDACSDPPSLLWDFGDGMTTGISDPAHIYAQPGTYQWTLRTESDGVVCIRTGTVKALPPCAVTCSATADPSQGSAPLLVAFDAAAAAENCADPLLVEWAFGDGILGQGPSVTHLYEQPGLYGWTMTASAGEASCSASGQVEAASPCILTCSAWTEDAGASLSVGFLKDIRAEGCTEAPAVLWEFGDGVTSPEAEPVHRYDAPGTYAWRMTATADGVSCIHEGTVSVQPVVPGDGNGDGIVSIGEVQQVMNMYLGLLPPGNGADTDGDGTISLGEVQAVVNAFLG